MRTQTNRSTFGTLDQQNEFFTALSWVNFTYNALVTKGLSYCSLTILPYVLQQLEVQYNTPTDPIQYVEPSSLGVSSTAQAKLVGL